MQIYSEIVCDKMSIFCFCYKEKGRRMGAGCELGLMERNTIENELFKTVLIKSRRQRS